MRVEAADVRGEHVGGAPEPQDAGEGLVAVHDGPVGPGQAHAGRVALEGRAVVRLRLPQRGGARLEHGHRLPQRAGDSGQLAQVEHRERRHRLPAAEGLERGHEAAQAARELPPGEGGEPEREPEPGQRARRQQPEGAAQRPLHLLGRHGQPHREAGPRGAAERGVGLRPVGRGAREHRLLALARAGDEVGGAGLARALGLSLGGGDHDAVTVHDGAHGAARDVGGGEGGAEALGRQHRDEHPGDLPVAPDGQRHRDRGTLRDRAGDQIGDLRLAGLHGAADGLDAGHARERAARRPQQVHHLPARGLHQGDRQPASVGVAGVARLLVERARLGRVEVARDREALEPGHRGVDLAVDRHREGARVEEQRLLHVPALVLVGPPDGDAGDAHEGHQDQAHHGQQEGPQRDLDHPARIASGACGPVTPECATVSA